MKNSAKTPKPLIGITAGEHSRRIPLLGCKFAVFLQGGRSIVLHHNQQNYQACDGFILSGGADINPQLYGETNTHSRGIDHNRDALEMEIIQHALQHNKPMLGICRGMQMLNVAHGGNLHQHAPSHFMDFIPTSNLIGKIFGRKHIKLHPNSKISQILCARDIRVNSIHHQALKEIGEGLHMSAADDYGVPQVLEHDAEPPRFIGVQWHPELMPLNAKQRRLFKHLLMQTAHKIP